MELNIGTHIHIKAGALAGLDGYVFKVEAESVFVRLTCAANCTAEVVVPISNVTRFEYKSQFQRCETS